MGSDRACNGICKQYKATKSRDQNWYRPGIKRCTVCEIFIYWVDLYCPCCRVKLKVKRKDNNSKNKRLKYKI